MAKWNIIWAPVQSPPQMRKSISATENCRLKPTSNHLIPSSLSMVYLLSQSLREQFQCLRFVLYLRHSGQSFSTPLLETSFSLQGLFTTVSHALPFFVFFFFGYF